VSESGFILIVDMRSSAARIHWEAEGVPVVPGAWRNQEALAQTSSPSRTWSGVMAWFVRTSLRWTLVIVACSAGVLTLYLGWLRRDASLERPQAVMVWVDTSGSVSPEDRGKAIAAVAEVVAGLRSGAHYGVFSVSSDSAPGRQIMSGNVPTTSPSLTIRHPL
jgi:hypothetical protein